MTRARWVFGAEFLGAEGFLNSPTYGLPPTFLVDELRACIDAWQAGKLAARLQAATSSGKPILLRIDYDAGHGFGSTKKSQYEERADTFAFMLWQAGVAGFQP